MAAGSIPEPDLPGPAAVEFTPVAEVESLATSEVDHANSSTLGLERTLKLGYLSTGRDFLATLRFFPGLEFVLQRRVFFNEELKQIFPYFFINTLIQKNQDILSTLAHTNTQYVYCYTQKWNFLRSILHDLNIERYPDVVTNNLLRDHPSLTRVLYQCTLCEAQTVKVVEEFSEKSNVLVNAFLNELHQLDITEKNFNRTLANLTPQQRERFHEFIYPRKERQMIFNSSLKSALGLLNVENHEIFAHYARHFSTSCNQFYSDIVIKSNNRLGVVKQLPLIAPQAIIDREFDDLSEQINSQIGCFLVHNTNVLSLLECEFQRRSIDQSTMVQPFKISRG